MKSVFTSAVRGRLVPCIPGGAQHLVLSWVNTSVKADVLINGCCWRLHMFYVLWLNNITYKSEAKPLGVYFCMFYPVCDKTPLGLGSFRVHSFTTQRVVLSLDETVFKPVCRAQHYLLHLWVGSFPFSLSVSCAKTPPLKWYLKRRECLCVKGRVNFLKRCSSKGHDTAL